MSKVLVLGGSGFLGQSLQRQFGNRAYTTFNTRPRDTGIHFNAVEARLSTLLATLPTAPSHVIITYGAINPEFCARDPEGSAKINVASVIEVAQNAMDAGHVPIFLSTDYVFNGMRGLREETEATSPTTQYGIQKVAVEDWLQTTGKPWIIVRASKLVSGDLDTHSVLGQWVNDIKAGREIRCATDQIFSPAHVDDVAAAIQFLIDENASGIFHVAGKQAMSRYDLADTLAMAIRRINADIPIHLTKARLADFPFLETRPLNTSLSTTKILSLNPPAFRNMTEICDEIAQQNFS